MNFPYDISIRSINSEPLMLGKFKGKKLLIVNTASACGFTPQYSGLQELYNEFRDKLEIIACPCNQFGEQEQGDPATITEFCEVNYGVNFTLTEKIEVLGANRHPLYTWLCSKSNNGVMDSEVVWNFQKYLIDENGKFLGMYHPSISPISEEIINAVNS